MIVTYNAPCVRVECQAPSSSVSTGIPVVKEYIEVDPYTGEVEVTPSAEAQILPTIGKRLLQNITIKPIPSNYGLVTWNGSTLTVS